MSDASARLDARLVTEARTHVAEVVARSALIGATAGAALAITAANVGGGPVARAIAAVAPALLGALIGYRRGRRAWSCARAADALERRHPADNLVITAEALGRGPASPWQALVADAAWSRIDARAPLSSRPVVTRAAGAVVLSVLAGLIPWPVRATFIELGSRPDASEAQTDPRITSLAVVVSLPPYLGGASVEQMEPAAVEVVAGGQVTLRAITTASVIHVSRNGGAALPAAVRDGVALITLPVPQDGTWLLTPGAADRGEGARIVTVRIVADAPPAVRIVAPGRDRREATPLSDLRVDIEASDDHALRDLRLRFTTVKGSGESLTFADRDVTARVTRRAPGDWTADAVIPLSSLRLEDGDLVVYRGVAVDASPGAAPVESDAFIVEIGPLPIASEAGGGGEDVDAEDRQAISQQLVIVKTERLHARRSGLSSEARLAEAQGLAIEQRMVRAEFVFLMGGEVQDEVEEAAHAHDLVEGRLENEAQAALLGATRAMSRAEARLAAGDTATALVVEREALRFLQQAFDRRRFLLRPAAERARIDPTRRLQGETAASSSQSWPLGQPQALAGWESVARAATALADARANAGRDPVATAAPVAALEPIEPGAAAAAAAIVRASTPDARAIAIGVAQRLVQSAAARRLAPAVAAPPETAVSGAVADALRRRRP